MTAPLAFMIIFISMYCLAQNIGFNYTKAKTSAAKSILWSTFVSYEGCYATLRFFCIAFAILSQYFYTFSLKIIILKGYAGTAFIKSPYPFIRRYLCQSDGIELTSLLSPSPGL